MPKSGPINALYCGMGGLPDWMNGGGEYGYDSTGRNMELRRMFFHAPHARQKRESIGTQRGHRSRNYFQGAEMPLQRADGS